MTGAPTLTRTEQSNSPVSDRLAARTGWQIDPSSSRVEFTIAKRWFVVPLRVTGHFSDVQGVITLDEQDPTTAQASIAIGASSIDTGNTRRDTRSGLSQDHHTGNPPGHRSRCPVRIRSFLRPVRDFVFSGASRHIDASRGDILRDPQGVHPGNQRRVLDHHSRVNGAHAPGCP